VASPGQLDQAKRTSMVGSTPKEMIDKLDELNDNFDA
jgi:hypothetical protein